MCRNTTYFLSHFRRSKFSLVAIFRGMLAIPGEVTKVCNKTLSNQMQRNVTQFQGIIFFNWLTL